MGQEEDPTAQKWQVLRERQFKANQELKMKANELEKLFAEHKLRVDKNAVTSSCSTNMSNLSVTPQVKVLDNQVQRDDAAMHKFSEFGLSDYCRGKLYETYTQKRDAKLREDWGSKKEEKEANMKAMKDSFERTAAEMKANLCSKRYEDRSKSFNTRSTMAMEEHPIGKNEEDLSFGNCGSKSSQAKKPPNKNLSSSIPTSSTVPIPRSSTETSNSSSRRRMMQPENALARSVPNFSDFRKENPKPSSGVSKTITRPPTRIHSRSKSNIENIIVVKEERKPRRSQSLQSLRKSTVVPTELGIVLTPSKCDKSDRFSQNAESKLFRGKVSSLGPGAGAVMVKMKGSVESKTTNSEAKSDELAVVPEESFDAAENEADKESETTKPEDHVNVNVDNVKPRLSHETEKLVYSGSEGGDASRSFSRVETSSVDEPTTFHTVGSVQNSPAESTVSRNSRVQQPFSYAHGASDIDASPIGSPGSWNSSSLNQVEAGAARMRKKWGSPQKPNLVSNSSHGHYRKDVTGGIKRLLHFGRKSRGPDDSFNESEYFSEQVQALRSSIPTPAVNFRMREPHLSRTSIKSPRSLFSLSSFRSKGNDSKPR